MVKQLVSLNQLRLSEFDPHWVLHTLGHVSHVIYAKEVTITRTFVMKQFLLYLCCSSSRCGEVAIYSCPFFVALCNVCLYTILPSPLIWFIYTSTWGGFKLPWLHTVLWVSNPLSPLCIPEISTQCNFCPIFFFKTNCSNVSFMVFSAFSVSLSVYFISEAYSHVTLKHQKLNNVGPKCVTVWEYQTP